MTATGLGSLQDEGSLEDSQLTWELRPRRGRGRPREALGRKGPEGSSGAQALRQMSLWPLKH